MAGKILEAMFGMKVLRQSFDSFCRKIEKYFEGSNHKMTE